MAFSSSSELLDWLSGNTFLNPQQVEILRPWVAAQSDLQAFCKELLRLGWISPYQVNQIIKHDPDSLIVGANRIQTRIGEGAMGQVFKAWNIRLGRLVAVKMLHADHALSDKAMERFRRETQAAAALVHPNIVLIRDADEQNHVPYLVMDYFDGSDLARKVRQEGPQPIRLAAEFIRQAAVGLQHAFELGVVHRDIKPSNMLLVRGPDGGPMIKLLDFGLAKFEREEEGQQPLTQAGRLIGTVDYIAPEQALDAHRADIRADIYSLGCTLYYLLTAKAPFPGADHLEKLSARINGSPPKLREIRPDAPPALADVLGKMMARDPLDRYQVPAEVAAALLPFARDVMPPPPFFPPVAPGYPPAAPYPPAMPVPMPVPMTTPMPPMMAAPMYASPVPVPAASPPNFWGADPAANSTAIAQADPSDFPFGSPADGNGASTGSVSDAARARERRKAYEERDSDGPPSSYAKPLIIGGLCILFLVLLAGGASLYLWRDIVVRPNNPVPAVPLGSMKLELDSPPDRVWAHGERKGIIVKVQRQNFKGPIELAVDPCPAWLGCEPVKVAPNKDVGELRLLVRYHDALGPQTITIVANSPAAHPASITYEMDLVAIRRK